MDKIAVLIPCYNESRTIEKVVLDFKRALPQATIYVYDNNSTDGTADIAARAGAVVRRERMQGKGNAMLPCCLSDALSGFRTHTHTSAALIFISCQSHPGNPCGSIRCGTEACLGKSIGIACRAK